MPLVVAQGALLEQVLDLTFPVWNEGLTRTAYAQWNAAQLKTPWGRQHTQRLALVDEAGELLSTAKRYRFDARIAGREGILAGIGAVFTPPDLRGRGHAATLIEQILERERADGALAAALFSEVGTAFYERLGFRPLALHEVTVRVARKGGAPAMLVRAGDDRDLPALAAMHETRAAGARFALRRDPSHIQHAIAKKRLLAGLGPAGLRQLEFFVAEEGHTAVAYVVLSVNAHGWTIQDAGDRDPAGARLGAMLQVLVAREPSHRDPLIRTWWPAGFPVPPQLELVDPTAPRDVLMLRPLTDIDLPRTADDVFYWPIDAF